MPRSEFVSLMQISSSNAVWHNINYFQYLTLNKRGKVNVIRVKFDSSSR